MPLKAESWGPALRGWWRPIFTCTLFFSECVVSWYFTFPGIYRRVKSFIYSISLLLSFFLIHFHCGANFLSSFHSVQFSSVAQLCPTLCDPMDYSTPGIPVHHQLPELAQTHVHWVGDAIQPSHPLSSPSSPAFNLSLPPLPAHYYTGYHEYRGNWWTAVFVRDSPPSHLISACVLLCKTRIRNMPSLPISTIWLEDLKEIKATIIESNKVMVMIADFYTSILRGPCFIRHYKPTRIYGLHMHTHTHIYHLSH